MATKKSAKKPAAKKVARSKSGPKEPKPFRLKGSKKR